MFSILKPYIFSLDPESAHDLAIKALKVNFLPESFYSVKEEELLETNLFRKKVKNPIGLAAGFDKSAEVYNSIFKLGFGFVEVGTITPKKQLGNPKPRIFRLEKDEALINRLGFNNHGSEIVAQRISENKPKGILGINIGPNLETKDKTEDFYICLSKLYSYADYIAINISSPNTEGLRDFHEENSMIKLLEGLNKLKKDKNIDKPLAIKLSPDINEKKISNIVEIINKYKIDGIIISNTTNQNREKLLDSNKNEIGGLSGQPVKNISTNLIKKFYKELNRKITIIGVGGVDSGKSAFEKITAGADVIQLYTGMVYRGPGVVKEIKKELISILKNDKIKNISDAVGINTWPVIFQELYSLRKNIMSKRCELTGVSPLKGHNVSHAKNKTKRRFLPNLKKVTFKSDILKKNIKLNVTNAALRTVDFKGGLDKYLMSAKSKKLSKKVKKLKSSIYSKG